MSIEERIHEQRWVWLSKGYPEPDTIMMSFSNLMQFTRHIQSMMPGNNFLSTSGKYKYMGMDIIDSDKLADNDIRVCKTQVL